MNKYAYSAPKAEVYEMNLEYPILTVSDKDVSIDVSLEDDGYGEVPGGYDGNWE